MSLGNYDVKHFDSAKELIQYLSPIESRWECQDFVFRGQGDSQYQLVPSACRRHPGSFFSENPTAIFGDKSDNQVLYEQTVLKRFLDGCDNSGLVVPGYSDEVKRLLRGDISERFLPAVTWPRDQYHELLAAAQHHGVPTRLLDWSRRSYVAAYFAATTADYTKSDSQIAIWALNLKRQKKWKTIKIIDPPGGVSRNLAAQSGIFTMQYNSDLMCDDYLASPLEESLELYQHGEQIVNLLKMTLSVCEVPKLVKYCSKLGVSGTTLFPGYEGVARDVVGWAKEHIGIKGFYELDELDADDFRG
ncbi:FRG domain-containing protein [Pseudomonas sp. WC2401]|uniref:FRG domain-containing protein n=1 Tax=Pseudomonas sp. WC2401 TaxID=3234143 RepID=A0AB39WUN5_9PSED